jgi:hypothetical protein
MVKVVHVPADIGDKLRFVFNGINVLDGVLV